MRRPERATAGSGAKCESSSKRPTSWSPSLFPSELRGCFFGPHAKEAYDLFFTAAVRRL